VVTYAAGAIHSALISVTIDVVLSGAVRGYFEYLLEIASNGEGGR
jgi:hypothetical protein